MAKPRLSIIVPVLNEAATLPEFLKRLQHWRGPLTAELIVVDGGSEDDTVATATPLVDKLLSAQRGRAAQMNAGASQAGAAYLMFLHCDSCLHIEPATLFGALAEEPAWGFFRIRLSGADWRFRLIERAMNWRSATTGVATGDQGLIISADLWRQSGGFAELPLMEDVEMCKRLREYARPRVFSPPLATSSRRWEQGGIFSTVVHMWYLRLAYWLGVAPEKLERSYYG